MLETIFWNLSTSDYSNQSYFLGSFNDYFACYNPFCQYNTTNYYEFYYLGLTYSFPVFPADFNDLVLPYFHSFNQF